jgi:hypothetical protein
VNARAVAACLCLSTASVLAADEPFGVLDIVLGTSYARLEQQLDFRDINTSLAETRPGKPDFGRRGYGCMKRDDPFADVGCVSHAEKINGVETREIRLHFIFGRLQQFSVTAELQHFDAVVGYLRARYGEPRQVAASVQDAAPSLEWQDETGRIVAYRGKDLVFVNFELASYAGAVKRKREGASVECT